MLGVIIAQQIGNIHNSGFAELNPAVTIAMVIAGKHGSGITAFVYFFGAIGSQIIGAIIGQSFVTIIY